LDDFGGPELQYLFLSRDTEGVSSLAVELRTLGHFVAAHATPLACSFVRITVEAVTG
jgi:hypothetical protein